MTYQRSVMMNSVLRACSTAGVLAVFAACSSTSADAPVDGGGGQGGSRTQDAAREVGLGGGGARPDAGRVDSGAEASVDANRPVDSGPEAEAGPLVCLTARYTNVTTFGAIFEGWTIAASGGATTPTLVPMPGVGPDGGFEGTLMELDTADGSPANGSAKLTIPFNEPNQTLTFAKNFNPGVNMSGTTVTAQIKLDSGLISSPTDIGEAFLVVKSTGNYLYAPATPIVLDPTAGWKTLTLNVDAPSPDLLAGYTPCDIREIDIVIRTGQTGAYRTAVVHIDTIAVSGGGDAGAPTASDAGPTLVDSGRDGANGDAADAASDGATPTTDGAATTDGSATSDAAPEASAD